MIVATQFKLDRESAEGELIEITVEASGTFERYASANPSESGYHLGSWDVIDLATGEPVNLTNSEKDYAVERLYVEV